MASIECVRQAEVATDTAYSEMEVAFNALVTEDLPSGSTEVIDDLDDPWFAAEVEDDGVYEVDPVHPLRRLSVWVRDRLAA
ncbi:MAG: hypothetical protein JO257_30660 [Deltaproteobacteria bacterium]|nr:hypothetical protein [Deltaproteobacteria bacterium]